MSDIIVLMHRLLTELQLEIDKQKETHAKAFGSKDVVRIIEQTDNNRKHLERWADDLRSMLDIMNLSGVFINSDKEDKQSVERDYMRNLSSITWTKPTRIKLFGTEYHVNTWKEALVKVCEILYQQSPDKVMSFTSNPTLNPNLANFSRERLSSMRVPYYSKLTSLYIETHHSAKRIYDLCIKMLKACSYSTNELLVEVRKTR